VNLKHYLDGAGSVDLFPPRREYRVDSSRTQAVIEERMQAEDITMEEAFRRELEALRRKHREIRAGQTVMTILMFAGLATTTVLALHDFSWWISLPPYLLAFGTLTAAQIRYRRRVAADPEA
jgi:hypothetical protein